jgi:enoyl-CoA hydratase
VHRKFARREVVPEFVTIDKPGVSTVHRGTAPTEASGVKFEFVSAEIADHVAVATMHRPPVNAVNLALLEQLTDLFDTLAMDDEVRAIILTGQGHTFCAGADLKDPVSRLEPAAQVARLRTASDAFFTILTCKKPTIAAMNGPALGAGLVLAASCDILLAAENAFLALPEVGVGLLGGARHAMRLCGHSLTRRMVLTGYRVSAAELYRIGAIEKCLPRDRLLDEARAIALEIAEKDAALVQRAKRALNGVEGMTLRDGYAYEHALTLDVLEAERQAVLGTKK